jgi:DNA-binding response OmpR family regulator
MEKLMDAHSHVLVVDDDEDTRGLLREILAKEGYDVETASDGKTALERITDRPPDLVM